MKPKQANLQGQLLHSYMELEYPATYLGSAFFHATKWRRVGLDTTHDSIAKLVFVNPGFRSLCLDLDVFCIQSDIH